MPPRCDGCHQAPITIFTTEDPARAAADLERRPLIAWE
jgi:hypothetical protein